MRLGSTEPLRESEDDMTRTKTSKKTICVECVALAENEPYDDNEFNSSLNRPTRWWHCGDCDAHLERYRGSSDVSCDCGAEYNAFGQRLRDDWRSNPSNYDYEIGDLDGYEYSQIRCEQDG